MKRGAGLGLAGGQEFEEDFTVYLGVKKGDPAAAPNPP